MGTHSAEYAVTLNNLSYLYYQRSEHGKAEEVALRALTISGANVFSSGCCMHALRMLTLGFVYAVEVFGAEHPQIARILQNLGPLRPFRPRSPSRC